MAEIVSYLLESNTINKSTKRYKCPYCELRLDRVKLVDHVDKNHAEMIPLNFTSTRVVFNVVNKKDRGSCVICGKETEWNENTARYERYCSKQCRAKASEIADKNMVRTYGVTTLLNDEEHQMKMLANRSISGSYKFADGGEVSYVGSYERKLLEFADKVMGYKSSDWMSPGPVIEYEFKGKKHRWITDQYLIPYNLVFDVKDGGDNPNNRDMAEYRDKQLAKEEAIKKQGKYNYIRLTNNNFAQLLYILAELKEQLMDYGDDHKPVIHINENALEFEYTNAQVKEKSFKTINEFCDAVVGAIVGIEKAEPIVVPYMMKNTFEVGYGITDDPNLDYFITDRNGMLDIKGQKFLKEQCEAYMMFKYNKEPVKCKFEPSNIVEAVLGKQIKEPDQLLYDEDFTKILTPDEKLTIFRESYRATLLGNKGLATVCVVESVGEAGSDIIFKEDDNGIFVENTINGLRSKSYLQYEDIPQDVINYINRGKL